MANLANIFVALVVGFLGVGVLVLFAFAQQGATRDFFLMGAGGLGALCIVGMVATGIRIGWNQLTN